MFHNFELTHDKTAHK